MEENQNQGQGQSLFQLNLDEQTGYTLRSASSWGKVLAIVGFIFAGLIVIMAIIVQSAISKYSSSNRYYDEDIGRSTRMLSTFVVVLYFIIALIQFISSLFMWNFASKISNAFKSNDQGALNAGFAGLRNYIALWAILLIICLLFVLISLAAGASGLGR